MRLWSIHPRYLDARGLVSLWREGLLARRVLAGETKGYKNHPQLMRFRAQPHPVCAIDAYLSFVLEEAITRHYRFDRSKIKFGISFNRMTVTLGQLEYEWQHLLAKLAQRDPGRFVRLKGITMPEPNPVMEIIPGPIEQWEKI